eukprot:CAMPEP_0116028348 /NCGR_PEP_ID=MMETSP0321-20121206/15339_1 /TAXON_ID=163516 /ORGANISM="Leptocylindrus danicus var. danicus, Strain B650" /LENGTH=227 /DNA_ID=CAMNT_0003502213 /DNA_START=141 /DNA_END=824 /DNA_ORIENTATION=+
MTAKATDNNNSLVPLDISNKCKLVLASQSPRRVEILNMIGLMNQFRAQPSPFDEDEIRDELKKQVNPPEYTRIMAERKAQALPLAGGCQEEMESSLPVIVIGSDTIVDLDGTILEKPRSEEEAVGMLRKLSGRKHQVHTGVALYSSINQFQDPVSSFTETAQVEFAQLSEADIAAYVASGEPMDKAGSYGIQGIGGQFVKGISGDFFAVMGFPMHRFSWELARILNE